MKAIPAILALLLLVSLSFAEFQQTNLTVKVDVNPDGSAKVTETVRISMDSGSPAIYDNAMSSYDITSWRSKTKLDFRFHFNRDIVDITDVTILAQPRDGCEGCVRDTCTICYGTIILTYELFPIANKTGSGLFTITKFKPRTSNYSLNTEALSFEASSSGGMVLPENTELVITLPEGAFNISVNPRPEKAIPADSGQGKTASFTWNGRIPLSNMGVRFNIEEPLSVEVMGFFSSVRDDILKILYSREGLAIVIIAGVVLASFIVLRRRKDN